MSTKSLTVYTNPRCVQCNATYKDLDGKGLAYDIQAAQDEDNNEMLIGLGLMQAPGVVVRQDGAIVDFWGGYRPDKIAEFAVDPAADFAVARVLEPAA